MAKLKKSKADITAEMRDLDLVDIGDMTLEDYMAKWHPTPKRLRSKLKQEIEVIEQEFNEPEEVDPWLADMYTPFVD